jgi:N4-gp56 family major capsid protein
MVLSEVAELMGLSMRMTEDQLSRDALAASATSYTCSGGTNGDSPTNISLSDIDTVATALLSNDAWMILDRQIGEDRFGTAPVREAYVALGHTDLSKDLNALNNFTPKWNYPNQSGAKVGAEWGAANNVRFFLSSVGLIRPNASNLGNNVYSVFITGLEAYGCIYQDNFSARILYRGPEFSDALYQNVTIGYTMSEVTRVLNDLWITQMLCTLNT